MTNARSPVDKRKALTKVLKGKVLGKLTNSARKGHSRKQRKSSGSKAQS